MLSFKDIVSIAELCILSNETTNTVSVRTRTITRTIGFIVLRLLRLSTVRQQNVPFLLQLNTVYDRVFQLFVGWLNTTENIAKKVSVHKTAQLLENGYPIDQSIGKQMAFC